MGNRVRFSRLKSGYGRGWKLSDVIGKWYSIMGLWSKDL